jgi:LmbE family N-acetylglucosaminyl deacetylase
MRVLIVAAHPDDEVLGAGGTVARHAGDGDDVRIVILCEGATVRYGPEGIAELNEQAHRAATVLGATGLSVIGLPDQRLDTLPISDVAAPIEDAIREHDPVLVYTHFGGDVNRDHQIAAEAVAIAARPHAAPGVREVLMFESVSTQWGATRFSHRPFDPTVFVDVSETLETKLKAMTEYRLEVRDFPSPRSLEALRDQARYWGSRCNLPAAEAFVPLRIVR